MEVHQRQVGGVLSEEAVHGGEGVVGVEPELTAADQVDDGDLKPVPAVVDAATPAGGAPGEVGGAEDIGILVQIAGDLHPVEGVVAQCDHVGPGGKGGLRLLGRDPQAGDVLPIDHGEADVELGLDGAQVAGEHVEAVFAHNISDGKDAVLHSGDLLFFS